MKRIFLLGFMGAGKTTAGKSLAKKLNCTFCDLDHYIESRYQKTVSQIFEELGEAKFREIEKKMLEEVSDFENIIIATGGGTPCFFENIETMKSKGLTIYLHTSPEVLSKRLIMAKEKRPLIANKSEDELITYIKNTLTDRDVHYNKSHLKCKTENIVTPEEMDIFVDQLLNDIDLFTKNNE